MRTSFRQLVLAGPSFAILWVAIAACGDSGDTAGAAASSSSSGGASSGASGSSGDSGTDASPPPFCAKPSVPPEKTFSQLSVAEKTSLCDYNACPFGGYDKSIECSSRSSVSSKDSLDDCLADPVWKRCADLSTASFVECAEKVHADVCKTRDVIGDPACSAFAECLANSEVDHCPLDKPLTTADLDTKYGWHPALRVPNACSTEDFTQFEANLKDTTITTWNGLGKDLTSSCSACLISSTEDTNWGIIVWITAGAGLQGFYNFGSCFGVVEGSNACGKALQYEEFCVDTQCGTCTTSSDSSACRTTVLGAGGSCKSFADDVAAACPNYADDLKACNDTIKAAKVLCGP